MSRRTALRWLTRPSISKLLSEFVAQLDPINSLADRAPGCVWRM